MPDTRIRETARGISRDGRKTSSRLARTVFSELMAMEPVIRRGLFKGLTEADQEQVLRVALSEAGTPLAIYGDDPVGFIEDVLNETLWSKSREVVSSVPKHAATAVPSCFGSSKTWGAARVDLWWTQVHAPGTALAVTIAPLWRQVVRQMWPEIRRAHNRAKLPGKVDTYQMKMLSADGGNMEQVSYGLVANKHDESAVQGIHSPHLLLVVDEAGGISNTVGRNLRAVLTGDARMLAIGNPPSDEEGSWFEGLCNDSSPEDDVNVIPISAFDTPALSGEDAPRCKSCPAGLPPHAMTEHLVTKKWVDDTLREFGEESAYSQAKVYARFPRGGQDRALPYSWVEKANAVLDPDPEEDEDFVAFGDLQISGEKDPNALVRLGSWIRLGVDVAADGGDELVVARSAGDHVSILHTSRGPSNADPNTVAGKVLTEIKRAEQLALAVDSPFPVRVKIDGIGVGWGVAGILEAWGKEGRHAAQIVKVVVSESTNREPDKTATFRPRIKRDEMWLAFRELLPSPKDDWEGAPPRIRLRVDRKTIAQLTAPELTHNSSGAAVVESKDSLRKRGMASPDRAEAVLLSVYEPAPDGKRRRKSKILTD